MANDKVYIFDEENIRINVYEESRNELHLINDNPIIEIVKIYEPGPQGPKGNDGGSYVLPENVVSSSIQIDSDISGSFTSISASLSDRVGVFENKTLISGSAQIVYSGISNIPAGIVSGTQQITSSLDTLYHRLGTGLFSASQQIQFSEISGLPSGILSSSNGFVSSSEQINYNLIQNKPTTILSASFALTASYISGSNSISSSYALTASYYQLPNNLVSGSDQLSSSYDLRYHRLGTGLISSSLQIASDISGSAYSKIEPLNVFSGSIESRVQRLEQITGSLFSFTSSINTLVNRLESQTGSYAFKTEITGAFNSASSSFQTRISTLENKTLFSGSNQVIYSQISSIPAGIISSSQQLPSNLVSGSDQISSSYDLKYERKGSGILSSSNQIGADISGSFISSSNSLSNRISNLETKSLFSSSQQVNYTQISNVPSGLISSSAQINTGSFSGSFSGNGNDLTGIQSSSYALTASYALNAGSSGLNNYTQTIGIRIFTQYVSITEGSKGYRHIGFNSDIIKIRGIANTTGSINLNIKRNNLLLGNYQLSNQTGSIDSTLTGWTSSLNSDDLIEFYVSQSSTYITDLTFFMDLQSR